MVAGRLLSGRATLKVDLLKEYLEKEKNICGGRRPYQKKK